MLEASLLPTLSLLMPIPCCTRSPVEAMSDAAKHAALLGETVTIAEQLEERSQGKHHLPLPHGTHTMPQHHSFLTHTLSPLTRRQDPHLYRRL